MDFIKNLQERLGEQLQIWFSWDSTTSTMAVAVIGVIVVVLISALIDVVISRFIGWLFPKIVERSGSETPKHWEAALQHQRVANNSAHVIGALVFYYLIPTVLTDFPNALKVASNLIEAYLIIMAVAAINSFLRASRDVWGEGDLTIGLPIRFATQAVQVALWAVGSILVVSVLFDTSVTVLLSSLAGMTAILALVFRDSILGFVAGIQLTGNDMLRTHDWIEVPKFGANGIVDEIGLTTVKVRNFDKTISMVPTHALVSDSFRNWRGMSDTGARRIKRAVNLDLNQVRFADGEMIERLRQNAILKSFLDGLVTEAKSDSVDEADRNRVSEKFGGLTNIGLFRIYLQKFIEQHPQLRDDFTTMVRQLEPTENGVPMEMYAFANTTNWVEYETLQSEIMDHVFSVLPEFDLKVFQLPTSLGR